MCAHAPRDVVEMYVGADNVVRESFGVHIFVKEAFEVGSVATRIKNDTFVYSDYSIKEWVLTIPMDRVVCSVARYSIDVVVVMVRARARVCVCVCLKASNAAIQAISKRKRIKFYSHTYRLRQSCRRSRLSFPE